MVHMTLVITNKSLADYNIIDCIIVMCVTEKPVVIILVKTNWRQYKNYAMFI